MTKAKQQKAHAKRRANLRMGISLSDNEYNDLIKHIQSGAAKFHSRQSNRISKFIVTINDEDYIAVYDRVRKVIVTFMTINPDPILQEVFGFKTYEKEIVND
jgi:hypothetical protein